jgi:hypothetical protein
MWVGSESGIVQPKNADLQKKPTKIALAEKNMMVLILKFSYFRPGGSEDCSMTICHLYQVTRTPDLFPQNSPRRKLQLTQLINPAWLACYPIIPLQHRAEFSVPPTRC